MGCTISRSQQTSSTQENCSLTISEMTSQPNPPTSASGTLQTLGSENDRLGKLPMEMKVALLAAMPDLETLRTVTLTVPGFYLAYKIRQRLILFQVLSNDLSPKLLGEACSLYAAGLIRRDQSGWKMGVSRLLNDYLVDRTLGANLTDQNVGILREMALGHLAIQEMAWKQAKWAMSNRPHLYDNPHLRIAPLSQTEQTRFYRAFYRYEIFAALFGRTPAPPIADHIGLRRMYTSRASALLESYDEWEIEEINCVRHFIHCFYQEVLERHASGMGIKIASSMYENVERVITATPFRQYLFQYEGAWLNDAANHLTALGLGFLIKMMRAKSHQEELHFLKTESWFEAMIDINPAVHNGWPRLDQKIPWFPPNLPVATSFSGENSGPSIGVEWARTTTTTVRSFRIVGSKKGWTSWLLSWGYAMWDSERLDKWGILRSDHSNFHPMVIEYGRKSRSV